MKTTSKRTLAKIQIAVAREFGKLAFQKGIKCAPVLDPRLMKMLEGKTVDQDHNSSMNIMKAWTQGWTIENLKD